MYSMRARGALNTSEYLLRSVIRHCEEDPNTKSRKRCKRISRGMVSASSGDGVGKRRE
jgi:hypothetical protein